MKDRARPGREEAATRGDYVTDQTGTFEECASASANSGSKWYFYPWHFITTDKLTIKEAFGAFYDRNTDKATINNLFSNRRLTTVQRAFEMTQKYVLDPENEQPNLDMYDFEDLLIALNEDLVR